MLPSPCCRFQPRSLATNALLTSKGWRALTKAAPGHVATVRELVIDALTPTQIAQLERIADRLLARLDPDRAMGLAGDHITSTAATD